MVGVNRSSVGFHSSRRKVSTKPRPVTRTASSGCLTGAASSLTVPSEFAAYVGGALGTLKGRRVQNWLDDVIVYTRLVDGHVGLVEKV